MQLDALIQKRFLELANKAEVIAGNTTERDVFRTGRTIHHISLPDAMGWGTSVLSLFRQSFGNESIHTQQFNKAFNQLTDYSSSFATVWAIFAAAKEDFEGGYLFDFRGLVKSEVLSDAMDQADELLSAGYKDPACVLIGVSLESAIKHLTTQHSEIGFGTLDKMNADLAKVGAYNKAKQKQVTAWADLRNKAAHGDWDQYRLADVQEMHSGVQRFIADHL